MINIKNNQTGTQESIPVGFIIDYIVEVNNVITNTVEDAVVEDAMIIKRKNMNAVVDTDMMMTMNVAVAMKMVAGANIKKR